MLSILIINWNSWPDLERCLNSIFASKYTDYEVLVVDNGSTDGSAEKLAEQFPAVKVHRNPANLGHTRAVNQGVERIESDYVLLLDADTELADDMIGAMMDFITARPSVSAVAPRTFNTDGSIQESARNFPSAMSGLFGRQSVLTRWFPNNRFSRRYLGRDNLGSDDPFQVEQISAACMLFRRSLYQEVGPWDEGYFGYWVETDWCFQLKKAGKEVWCVPSVSVWHHESNHVGKKRGAARIWDFNRGAYRLYRKHYTLGVLDPRALFASAALTIRALLQIVGDSFRKAPEAQIAERGSPGSAVVADGDLDERVAVREARKLAKAKPVFAIPYEPQPKPSIPVRLAEGVYRALEILAALVVVILVSPLLLLVTVLIRWDSPGPALFWHQRTGRSKLKYGRELMHREDIKPPAAGFEPDRLYWSPTYIKFPKYRTMVADAAQRHPELYWWNYDVPPEQFQKMYYKLEEDPRLTRVGRWLRKTTIDELPNLFSVIRGDVRLVGPRPEAREVQGYYTEEQMIKFTVKPGVTCLSKIHGRGELSVQEQIDLDLEYVKTRSLGLDLKILFLTVWGTLTQRGAF